LPGNLPQRRLFHSRRAGAGRVLGALAADGQAALVLPRGGQGAWTLANLDQIFSKIATWIAHQAGRAYIFVLAVAVVVLWAVSGPLFGFSLSSGAVQPPSSPS
jgi:hypothetical protein